MATNDKAVRDLIGKLARDIGTVESVSKRRGNPTNDDRLMHARLEQWQRDLWDIQAAAQQERARLPQPVAVAPPLPEAVREQIRKAMKAKCCHEMKLYANQRDLTGTMYRMVTLTTAIEVAEELWETAAQQERALLRRIVASAHRAPNMDGSIQPRDWAQQMVATELIEEAEAALVASHPPTPEEPK